MAHEKMLSRRQFLTPWRRPKNNTARDYFDGREALLLVDEGTGKLSNKFVFFICAAISISNSMGFFLSRKKSISRRAFIETSIYSIIMGGLIPFNTLIWKIATDKKLNKLEELLIKKKFNTKRSSLFNGNFIDELEKIAYLQKDKEKPVTFIYLNGHGNLGSIEGNLTSFIEMGNGFYPSDILFSKMDEIKGKKLVFVDSCQTLGFVESLKKHPRAEDYFLAVSSERDLSGGVIFWDRFYLDIIKSLEQGGEMSSYFTPNNILGYTGPLSYNPMTLGKFDLDSLEV